MRQTSFQIADAFLHGRAKKVGNTVTDGKAVYLFGNKIAEWREDGLWITNCGWQTPTTKDRLNAIGRYVNFGVHQRKKQWYLASSIFPSDSTYHWDGNWARVHKELPAEVDLNAKNKQIVISKRWESDGGYRGRYVVDNAVFSATDTGMWEDSPYRSDEAMANIKYAQDILKMYGIKSKVTTLETSNVFCINHFVVVSEYDYEKAKHYIQTSNL
jgi:hypothetical protein